jgi:hypothetical protein
MFHTIGSPFFAHPIEDPEAIARWAPKHGFAAIVQLTVHDILDDARVRFVLRITRMKVGSEPDRTCWTISGCVEFYDRFRDAGHDQGKTGCGYATRFASGASSSRTTAPQLQLKLDIHLPPQIDANFNGSNIVPSFRTLR